MARSAIPNARPDHLSSPIPRTVSRHREPSRTWHPPPDLNRHHRYSSRTWCARPSTFFPSFPDNHNSAPSTSGKDPGLRLFASSFGKDLARDRSRTSYGGGARAPHQSRGQCPVREIAVLSASTTLDDTRLRPGTRRYIPSGERRLGQAKFVAPRRSGCCRLFDQLLSPCGAAVWRPSVVCIRPGRQIGATT